MEVVGVSGLGATDERTARLVGAFAVVDCVPAFESVGVVRGVEALEAVVRLGGRMGTVVVAVIVFEGVCIGAGIALGFLRFLVLGSVVVGVSDVALPDG